MIIVPQAFTDWRTQIDGETGRAWVADLPDLVRDLCLRWDLTVEDEPVRHGALALVVPVRHEQQRCVLKVSWHEDGTADEATALRAWDGRGAVRLLAERPEDGALLLERLEATRTLRDLDIYDAAQVAGRLIRRLAIPPPPPSLGAVADVAAAIAQHLPARQAELGNPVPGKWVAAARENAFALSERESAVLIHADLHYGNVLAGRREPWLAIDPRALRGDPEFSIPELMWTRADDLPDAQAVHRLLTVLTDAADLDAGLAHAWVVTRCVDYWLWGLEHGLTIDPVRCERILTALLP